MLPTNVGLLNPTKSIIIWEGKKPKLLVDIIFMYLEALKFV